MLCQFLNTINIKENRTNYGKTVHFKITVTHRTVQQVTSSSLIPLSILRGVVMLLLHVRNSLHQHAITAHTEERMSVTLRRKPPLNGDFFTDC